MNTSASLELRLARSDVLDVAGFLSRESSREPNVDREVLGLAGSFAVCVVVWGCALAAVVSVAGAGVAT